MVGQSHKRGHVSVTVRVADAPAALNPERLPNPTVFRAGALQEPLPVRQITVFRSGPIVAAAPARLRDSCLLCLIRDLPPEYNMTGALSPDRLPALLVPARPLARVVHLLFFSPCYIPSLAFLLDTAGGAL